MSPTDAFTIEAWIKGPIDANRAFIYDRINTDDGFGMTAELGTAHLFINGGLATISSKTNVQDGNWHHIAGTYDKNLGKLYIYVDGIVEDSALYNSPITYNPEPRNGIGGPGGSANYFSGSIDEVRVWGLARSVLEIMEYKDSCLAGNESGLLAYYIFEEGSGTITNDLSSNANHGSLTHGVLWNNDVPLINCKPNSIEGIDIQSSEAFIYPNPTDGNLTIDLGKDFANVRILLINSLGQIISTQQFENTDFINYEILGSAGIYYIRVETEALYLALLKVVKH